MADTPEARADLELLERAQTEMGVVLEAARVMARSLAAEPGASVIAVAVADRARGVVAEVAMVVDRLGESAATVKAHILRDLPLD